MKKKKKKSIGLMGHISRIRPISFLKKTKVFLSVLILIALFCCTYFAYTRAYTPGDTTGVKKVMPPPYSDPALVGYWPMDDNAASTTVIDSSGSGNNGTAQANTNTKSTTNAVHNRAMTFNGTSDYVNIGGSETTFDLTENYTISLWVKISSYDSGNNGIISKDDGSNNGWLLYELVDNSKLTYLTGPSNYFSFGEVVSNYFGIWKHVVIVADTTNATAYLDGVSVGSGALGKTTNNLNPVIGVLRPGPSGGYFNGSIDDVRIYSKALTASDVYALYQAGRPRTGDNGFSKMLFPPIDQSVVGWWKLNDAAGQTVVKDWSSNNNTGTSANNIVSATGYTGVANTAMTFNGTTDYVSVTSVDAGINSTDSLWIYPNSLSGLYVLFGEADYDFLYHSYIADANHLYYRIGTVYVDFGVHGLTLNTWNHLVFVRGGNNVSYYLNGMLINSTIGAFSDMTTQIDRIGANSAGNYPFSGSISDVRIYNRALSANEVKVLYMRGRP